MPKNKSPTAPNLWMQFLMTSVKQPAPAMIGNDHPPPAPSKDCPNCTQQHPASRANCSAQDSHCSKCDKIDTGDQNAVVASHLNQGMHLCQGCAPNWVTAWESRCPPRIHNCHPGRGGKTDAIDVGKDHSLKMR